MINAGPCFRCKCDIFLPDSLHDAARRSERISFWCPYGHEQHFPAGETDEAKLRRERDRLAQQIAQRDDEIARQRRLREEAERSLTATKGVVTRMRNRVGHGICPCCTRTFGNLQRHMKTQHPTYVAEAAE
jgi:hypothetical protein